MSTPLLPARARALEPPVLPPGHQLDKGKHGLMVPLRATNRGRMTSKEAHDTVFFWRHLGAAAAAAVEKKNVKWDDFRSTTTTAMKIRGLGLFSCFDHLSRGLLSYTVKAPHSYVTRRNRNQNKKHETGHDFGSRCCCCSRRRSPCRRRCRRRCWCVFFFDLLFFKGALELSVDPHFIFHFARALHCVCIHAPVSERRQSKLVQARNARDYFRPFSPAARGFSFSTAFSQLLDLLLFSLSLFHPLVSKTFQPPSPRPPTPPPSSPQQQPRPRPTSAPTSGTRPTTRAPATPSRAPRGGTSSTPRARRSAASRRSSRACSAARTSRCTPRL